MIFVTVGTQKPFPRLLAMIRQWAEAHPAQRIVLQGGPGAAAEHFPDNVTVHEMLTAGEFDSLVEQAEVVVAHAGIGTILACLDAGVPVIVVPRRAGLGEHRNDHQVDTAAALTHLERVYFIEQADELAPAIERAHTLTPAVERTRVAQADGLVHYVRGFVGV